MNEAKAREILGLTIQPDGHLMEDHPTDKYDDRVWWIPGNGNNKTAELNGEFTPDELEAIAWWMRNKGE